MGLDIYFHKVKTHTEEIGYFRKVNFLVGAISDITGKEIEDCENIFITKENAEELRDRCIDVLLAKSDFNAYCEKEAIPDDEAENMTPEFVAESILPTTQGFFFGSYEYDEYYYEDVQEVLDYLNNTLIPEFDNLEDNESIAFYIWY